MGICFGLETQSTDVLEAFWVVDEKPKQDSLQHLRYSDEESLLLIQSVWSSVTCVHAYRDPVSIGWS